MRPYCIAAALAFSISALLPAAASAEDCANRGQLDETGCNYVVGQFAFGDLSLAETLRSVALFTDEVMPALRQRATVEVGGP